MAISVEGGEHGWLGYRGELGHAHIDIDPWIRIKRGCIPAASQYQRTRGPYKSIAVVLFSSTLSPNFFLLPKTKE